MRRQESFPGGIVNMVGRHSCQIFINIKSDKYHPESPVIRHKISIFS